MSAKGISDADLANMRRWVTPDGRSPQNVDVIALIARLDAAERERDDLKSSVIAFAAPWAVQYAQDFGFPANHLHATHYDILAKCGARLVDFTRHEPDGWQCGVCESAWQTSGEADACCPTAKAALTANHSAHVVEE